MNTHRKLVDALRRGILDGSIPFANKPDPNTLGNQTIAQFLANDSTVGRVSPNLVQYMGQYVAGEYRDLLRKLRAEPASTATLLLQVLCILRLPQDEDIAGLKPRDYIREHLLPKLRDAEFATVVPKGQLIAQGLDAFSRGFPLPDGL